MVVLVAEVAMPFPEVQETLQQPQYHKEILVERALEHHLTTLAVAEVQPDLSMRATAKVVGDVPDDAKLAQLVNLDNQGRCAITLDPRDKFPGQQPYQGVVPLHGDQREKIECLSEVLEHYMLQSEQLDTKLILAADDKVAAGLLIQRLPVQGEGNLAGRMMGRANEDEIGLNEDYNRIAILAASLTREELLTLDVDTILRRLFWEEKVLRFPAQTPRFACTCSSGGARHPRAEGGAGGSGARPGAHQSHGLG